MSDINDRLEEIVKALRTAKKMKNELMELLPSEETIVATSAASVAAITRLCDACIRAFSPVSQAVANSIGYGVYIAGAVMCLNILYHCVDFLKTSFALKKGRRLILGYLELAEDARLFIVRNTNVNLEAMTDEQLEDVREQSFELSNRLTSIREEIMDVKESLKVKEISYVEICAYFLALGFSFTPVTGLLSLASFSATSMYRILVNRKIKSLKEELGEAQIKAKALAEEIIAHRNTIRRGRNAQQNQGQ